MQDQVYDSVCSLSVRSDKPEQMGILETPSFIKRTQRKISALCCKTKTRKFVTTAMIIMLMGLIGLSIGLAYVTKEIIRIRDNQIVTGFDGYHYNLTTFDVKLKGEYFPIKVSHWVPHSDPSGRNLAATDTRK